MTDLRQAPQYGLYLKKIGWEIEKINGCQIFLKKLPLLGYFLKIQRPEKIPLKKIEKIAKQKRVFCLKIEPLDKKEALFLEKRGFKKDCSPYTPSKTLQINLKLSEKEILSQMKKDARYSIRRAEKNKLKISEKTNIESFHQAWKKHNQGRLWIPPLSWLKSLADSFGNNFFQLVAEGEKKDDLPLAGIILLKYDQIIYYYYAFSSIQGKKLFAPYLLVWQGIKLAKKQGIRIFDFEGIEDPRYQSTKSWRGFTHFKKSFGGKEIKYPGSLTKFSSPFFRFFFPFL